jgi:hypothetical protein
MWRWGWMGCVNGGMKKMNGILGPKDAKMRFYVL